MLAAFTVAQADVIVPLPAPIPGEVTTNWGQFGGNNAPVGHAFVFTTSTGEFEFGSFAITGGGLIKVQGTAASGWRGNFSPGDHVLYTNGHGPLTLTFDNGYSDVGAYIQTLATGNFTAELKIYNGTTGLDTLTVHGVSNNHNDGTAVFLGAKDLTVNNITQAVFSITVGPSLANLRAFAIDGLYLSSTVPEPGTLVLLGSGLIGLAGFARRRVSR